MSPHPGLRKVRCHSFGARRPSTRTDCLAVEEPIEYRIAGRPVAMAMRTPGHDRELAVGFLFNEGWISGPRDIGALSICSSGEHPDIGNVADLIPPSGRRAPCVSTSARRLPRLSTVTSSCGVCGKRTIAEVLASVPPLPPGGPGAAPDRIPPEVIRGLPATLRPAQPLFQSSGALHAAGIFDREGRLLLSREDVGRHNAVDKVIGAFLLRGEVPLRERLLLVSGRASFEIVQKCLRAGIRVVAAISGVSSLARDLAAEGGITLIGFLRDRSFQVYSHQERIRR